MGGLSKLENAKEVETLVIEVFRSALVDGLIQQEVPEEAVEPAV
jgi:hypothetical protein